jgi:hypothetical protein
MSAVESVPTEHLPPPPPHTNNMTSSQVESTQLSSEALKQEEACTTECKAQIASKLLSGFGEVCSKRLDLKLGNSNKQGTEMRVQASIHSFMQEDLKELDKQEKRSSTRELLPPPRRENIYHILLLFSIC